MMELASIITRYEEALLNANDNLLPSQLKALTAIKNCRTPACGEMQAVCSCCGEVTWITHSCGHRSCPKCQNHTATQWLERQKKKLLSVTYFLVTFTLPAQLRPSAYSKQRAVYTSLFQTAVASLKELAAESRFLDGDIGMTGVLHTHTRQLNYHPHVHFIVPGGGINRKMNTWKKTTPHFLIRVEVLSKLFRGKFLASLRDQGISYPSILHKIDWVVHSKPVGSGEKSLEYLSRYIYRGVISEKNIVSDQDGIVTFAYIDSETKVRKTRSLPGPEFLKLLLMHVLPKGFRRVRDYGFLHGAAQKTLAFLQLMLNIVLKPLESTPRPEISCPNCGKPMKLVSFKVKRVLVFIRGSPVLRPV